MEVPRKGVGVPRQARQMGWAAVLAAALACTMPAERALERSRALGLTAREIRGDPYVHVLLDRADTGAAGPVFVYLEGDADPARVAARLPFDPTPDPTIALELMAVDPGPAVYLGRPGQLGVRAPATTWTGGRYGEPVVSSLVAALRRSGVAEAQQGLVLVGVSGGGTLATLMAERMTEARALVTVAGNLDVAAWTQHRREPPLVDSLDPARQPPLRPSLVQLHLLGDRDRTVPPELARAFLARQAAPRVRRFPEFDHRCCWASVWPAIAVELRSELRRAEP